MFVNIAFEKYLKKCFIYTIVMAMVSKFVNALSYDEYLNIYSSLNHPNLIPHYKPNGCLRLRCDGKLIEYKTELEEYQRQENEQPHIKHHFEMEFVPFQMFKLIKTSNGFKHCSIDEV